MCVHGVFSVIAMERLQVGKQKLSQTAPSFDIDLQSNNMATTMKEAVSMYQKLNKEWNKKPPSLDKCGAILGQLKVWSIHTLYLKLFVVLVLL